MKQRIAPTDKEWFLPEGETIISKTDTKGRITYGNGILLEITGFSEAELLGKQHNIVRHPDMPRGVFHLLWETVKAGEEFNGYVKNLRKDGGFYWVFANVTPSYNSRGELVGYYSVRRKPSAAALKSIQPVYQQMLAAERAATTKEAISASRNVLQGILETKGVSYDEFVFTL